MKRSRDLTVGALAIAGALLLHGWLSRPASAQGVGPRWEYKVFRFRSSEYEDKRDYREILEREGGDGRKADSEFQQHVLNFLGRDGWELVALERRFPDQLHFYLKRRAP